MGEPPINPCYCTNLRRAARIISEIYDNALRQAGMTSAQCYLLISLSALEPIDTTHFAARVDLDRSTLVRNIRVLQNNGWVEDVSNSVKHQFRLTESGRTALRKSIPLWEEAQARFLERMSREDAAELMRLLLKVQDMKR